MAVKKYPATIATIDDEVLEIVDDLTKLKLYMLQFQLVLEFAYHGTMFDEQLGDITSLSI